MNDHFKEIILKSTQSDSLREAGIIQSLWSGYGKIVRYSLTGGIVPSVVVKHVHFPDGARHPRGWNTDLSHRRKMRSYDVETAWYRNWSSHCRSGCKVPQIYALESGENELLMVMEDLDVSGYPARAHDPGTPEIEAVLGWLAAFHASFLEQKPEGLWPVGTYWHLDTRPDELEELTDRALKKSASLIDQKLNSARFLTIVHGDAKIANFCFSPDGSQAAAVDFQYVGGGCGMKDVAYFISSCLDEEACERNEGRLLDFYFDRLQHELNENGNTLDFELLEDEWRTLYPVAWTDFYRFLKGWSPGHWKIHSYSERLAAEVLQKLGE